MRNRLGFIALALGAITMAVMVAVLHSILGGINLSEPAPAPAPGPRPLIEQVFSEPEPQHEPGIIEETHIPDLVRTAEAAIPLQETESIIPHAVKTETAETDIIESTTVPPRQFPQIPDIRQTPPRVIPPSPQPEREFSASAIVIQFSGRVMLTRNGRFMPVRQGFELEQGDRISTASGSRVKIRFNDGTALNLGENTEISIDEYIFTPDTPEQCTLTFRFMRGMGRMITGAITRIRPESLNVRTQMATIGMRGCDVAVSTMAHRVDVYVVDLPRDHAVEIGSTSDGRALYDMQTGEELIVPEYRRDQRVVTNSFTMVSVIRGEGMTARPMRGTDMQHINAGMLIHFEPGTEHTAFPTGSGLIVELRPEIEKPEDLLMDEPEPGRDLDIETDPDLQPDRIIYIDPRDPPPPPLPPPPRPPRPPRPPEPPPPPPPFTPSDGL